MYTRDFLVCKQNIIGTVYGSHLKLDQLTFDKRSGGLLKHGLPDNYPHRDLISGNAVLSSSLYRQLSYGFLIGMFHVSFAMIRLTNRYLSWIPLYQKHWQMELCLTNRWASEESRKRSKVCISIHLVENWSSWSKTFEDKIVITVFISFIMASLLWSPYLLSSCDMFIERWLGKTWK